MPAEVLTTHSPALFAEAVRRAVDILKSGGVVGLPTETVYGLAANAFSNSAVAAIYAVKGRPAYNPVIVHVASATMARECCTEWPPLADRLASRFWPGPMTLVLPRSFRIPETVSAGGNTVGIRWPSHPFMQAVIRACGFPLAAPSANPSNSLSPTSAEHVILGLGERIPIIVDGGHCAVGIESTVIDVTGPSARILRPGIIHADQIKTALEDFTLDSGSPLHATTTSILRSPGQLTRHYSPRAPLRVLNWTSDGDLVHQLADSNFPKDRIHILAHTRIPSLSLFPQTSFIPDDPEAFARALFGYLHACDQLNAALIVIESVPTAPEWEGIRDRLARASSSPTSLNYA